MSDAAYFPVNRLPASFSNRSSTNRLYWAGTCWKYAGVAQRIRSELLIEVHISPHTSGFFSTVVIFLPMWW